MEDAYVGLAVLILMAFDIASGYLAAIKNQEVSSSVMRGGILKKCGSVLVLLTAYVVEHLGAYIGIDQSICVSVLVGIAGLLAFMEINSILENACKVNPDLPIASLFSAFGVSDTCDRDRSEEG